MKLNTLRVLLAEAAERDWFFKVPSFAYEPRTSLAESTESDKRPDCIRNLNTSESELSSLQNIGVRESRLLTGGYITSIATPRLHNRLGAAMKSRLSGCRSRLASFYGENFSEFRPLELPAWKRAHSSLGNYRSNC